jgi:hypothetical protein
MRKKVRCHFTAAAALTTLNFSAIAGYMYHKLPPILTDFLVVASAIVLTKSIVDILFFSKRSTTPISKKNFPTSVP